MGNFIVARSRCWNIYQFVSSSVRLLLSSDSVVPSLQSAVWNDFGNWGKLAMQYTGRSRPSMNIVEIAGNFSTIDESG
jgi:hypothetical protein